MKKSTINLGSTEQHNTARKIIEDNLVTLLGMYNAHDVYSGLRYINFKITTDISIIIKMLNPFPEFGKSYVLYVYISSIDNKRLLFSTAMQYDIGEVGDKLIEIAVDNIASIIMDSVELYKVTKINVIHNLEDSPPNTKSYTSVKLSETDTYANINSIVLVLVTKLDKYINRGIIDLKCSMSDVDIHYSITIEYLEMDERSAYYIRVNKRVPGMDKTDIIFNEEDFIEKMTMLLNQLFRIYDMATLPNDKRKIKFYLLNSESMDI